MIREEISAKHLLRPATKSKVCRCFSHQGSKSCLLEDLIPVARIAAFVRVKFVFDDFGDGGGDFFLGDGRVDLFHFSEHAIMFDDALCR